MSLSSLKTSLPAGRQGFTLIELLLVIGVIAILSSIVIVAINPNKQLGDARNARRLSDVKVILDAVYQYSIDNNGALPDGIPTIATNICRSGVNMDCTSLVNLNVLTGAYMVAIPVDPQAATASDTHYAILRSAGRITVSAPDAEQSAVITVTR